MIFHDMRQAFWTLGWILLVFLLHAPAVMHDWYATLWWYDVMMHTLGGVASGVLAYLLTSKMLKSVWHAPLGFLLSLGAVFSMLGIILSIGVGWEWLEAICDAWRMGSSYGVSQMGLRDTMLDLLFDTLGGVLGVALTVLAFPAPQHTASSYDQLHIQRQQKSSHKRRLA